MHAKQLTGSAAVLLALSSSALPRSAAAQPSETQKAAAAQALYEQAVTSMEARDHAAFSKEQPAEGTDLLSSRCVRHAR
jgi:hypothetical protein